MILHRRVGTIGAVFMYTRLPKHFADICAKLKRKRELVCVKDTLITQYNLIIVRNQLKFKIVLTLETQKESLTTLQETIQQ